MWSFDTVQIEILFCLSTVNLGSVSVLVGALPVILSSFMHCQLRVHCNLVWLTPQVHIHHSETVSLKPECHAPIFMLSVLEDAISRTSTHNFLIKRQFPIHCTTHISF